MAYPFAESSPLLRSVLAMIAPSIPCAAWFTSRAGGRRVAFFAAGVALRTVCLLVVFFAMPVWYGAGQAGGLFKRTQYPEHRPGG